ncbi:unnamed protein product [Cuscuta campestris]|uniref:Uncharacterized protein n=1 Tax=Cuscuta campestris TaxID=132261 RepID=A0A484MG58_9ASTE|nr:unnamed protein product [Cuscuta campestris]
MVSSSSSSYYYGTTIHESIASLCKNLLQPFSSFKKRRLPAIAAAEQLLSKQQSDNLKWQQDSFHQILNLMGLSREGILAESEVSSFRSHLLHTLTASPPDLEHSSILRDKLIFLQELLYAKCISEEEYHWSKRPLLQRLAVQGGEIEARNVILGSKKDSIPDEEWSVIDLTTPNKKQVRGEKMMKKEETNDPNPLSHSMENPFWSETKSILMEDSSSAQVPCVKKIKKKAEKAAKKKQWVGGFDGFKKWKKTDPSEDETVPLSMAEKPDRKPIKKKATPDFFVNKVLGENIKKELSRIQTKLSEKNPCVQFTDDQIEAISTTLPVDKADLKMFFPKEWCDRYGDEILGVVSREIEKHAAEMGAYAQKEKHESDSKKWETFQEDDENEENCHPNMFGSTPPHRQEKYRSDGMMYTSSSSSGTDKGGFKYNPFFDVL